MATPQDKRIDDLEQALTLVLHKTHEYGRASQKYAKEIQGTYSNMTERLIEKLGELGGTLTTSYEQNKPVNAAGAYKDMINQLSAVNQSIKDKPVPVWNWPQYASVGVRNSSFTNIDPATEQDAAFASGYCAQKITLGTGVVYIASATTGSTYAQAVWQACKIDYSDLTNIRTTWANGGQLFNNIATNLTALSYS